MLVNITFVCRITICIIGPDATLLFLRYIFFLSPEKRLTSSLTLRLNRSWGRGGLITILNWHPFWWFCIAFFSCVSTQIRKTKQGRYAGGSLFLELWNVPNVTVNQIGRYVSTSSDLKKKQKVHDFVQWHRGKFRICRNHDPTHANWRLQIVQIFGIKYGGEG